jgi:hypothetical protein
MREHHIHRHPSESWDIHGAGATIANGDTPAFAGVTNFGRFLAAQGHVQ